MEVSIDTESLLKLAKRLEVKGSRANTVIARTLNYMGEEIVDEVTNAIASQTGLTNEIVRQSLKIEPATSSNLTFHIDAKEALVDAPETRSMRNRGFVRRPDEFFRQSELVNIVTMEDELVCKICQDLHDHGPYTIEDARMMIPAHPHCRCLVQSYQERRTTPMEFRKGEKTEVSKITMQKLVQKLRSEINILLKAK